MIRQSDPEEYHVTLLLGGGLGLDHAGQTDTYGPHDLWISDTSRPYDVQPLDDRDCRMITGVCVEFPNVLLPIPPDRVGQLLGRRLSGRAPC